MNNTFAQGSGGSKPSNAKDSLFSGDAFEVILGISEGPINGIKGSTIEDKLKNVYLDGTPILLGSGTKSFTDSQIILSYERGTPVSIDEDPEFGQTPIPYLLGGNASPVNVGEPLAHMIPVIRTVPSVYRNQYNKIEVRILINRLVRITDEGTKELGVGIKIEYRKPSNITWKTKQDFISGKTLAGGFVKEYEFYVDDTSEDYEIRVTMLHENDPDGDVRELTWLTYEIGNSLFKNDVSRREVHPGTAMVAMVAKIGENFHRIPNITAVWQGLLCAIPSNYDPETRTYDETSPWDGTFLPGKYYTNNPFWVAREIITNPRFGMARYNPTVMVDDFSLYEEAKYADTPRTVVTASGPIQIPMFTFNGVISKQMLGLELINYILGSAFAQAVEYSSGFIRIVSDRNTPSIMTVTPEMCMELHEGVPFTYTSTDLKDRYNEVSVTYVDPDIDWQPQFLGPFVDNDAQLKQGVNSYEFEAIGTTNPYEAEYKAFFNLISSQTETRTVSFNIPGYALSWDIFDIIDIIDPDMDWGLSGRANRIEGTQVYLREAFYFEESGRYEFLLQTRNAGEILYHFNIPVEGSYPVLTLENPVTEDIAKYPAFSITRNGLNPGMAKPFRVVNIAPLDGHTNIFSITATEINRNKWQQALDLELGSAPRYNFEMPRMPEGPKNLRYSNTYTLPAEGGASEDFVSLTWDGPEGSFVGLSYTIFVSENNEAFWDAGGSRVNFFEFKVEKNVDYRFQVRLNYMGLQLYSDILSYTLPEYSAVDFDISKLSISVNGEYRGEDLYYRLNVLYSYSGTGTVVVDLLKSKKIQAILVEFYDIQSGRTLILSREITTNDDILLGSDQLDLIGRVAPVISIEVKLIALDGSVFPAEAIAASVEVGILPNVTNIAAGATSRALSGIATLTTELRRNMTIKWFLGELADGSDRFEIAQSKTIHGYTVEPGTDYYLWAQTTGIYGDGLMFPAGEGVLVQSTLEDTDGNVVAYRMVRSAGLVVKLPDGNYSPPVVTVSSIYQPGSGPIEAFPAWFKVFVRDTSEVITNTYTSAAAEDHINYTIPPDTASIQFKLYKDNLFEVPLDEENTQVIQEPTSYNVVIESSNGTVFRVGRELTTTLIARIFKNGVEVTADIEAARFQWRRTSGNSAADVIWNSTYASGYKEITIDPVDVQYRATFHCDILS